MSATRKDVVKECTPLMWLSETSLAVRNSLIQGSSRTWRWTWHGKRLRGQARPCPSPRHHLSGVIALFVHMHNHSLTGCLFLFNLQEEAARILAHQPVSVGTCAALKTPTLQWMCKRSCMENRAVCPCFLSPGFFHFLTWKQDVVHAIQNEEPFTCHGLHDWLNLVVHLS